MMFRQILVTEKDRYWQLVFWRKDEKTPLKIYTLNTVTYNITCAPFLAMRCLKQLTKEEGNRFPLAKQTLMSDFYIDDILTADTIADAIALQKQLTLLLSKEQFYLRKWRSNDEQILGGNAILEYSKKRKKFFKSILEGLIRAMPQLTERQSINVIYYFYIYIRFDFPLSHPQCIKVYSCQRSMFK